MTQKILITEVGGENCPQIITLSGDESNGQHCKINAMELCSGENCPHGVPVSEAADKMLRFSLLGRDFDYADLSAQRQQREEELEHLLEVQNGKKQN